VRLDRDGVKIAERELGDMVLVAPAGMARAAGPPETSARLDVLLARVRGLVAAAAAPEEE
jgi:hypothetical protein